MPVPDLDHWGGEKPLCDPGDLEAFATELERTGSALHRRVNTDPEGVERGPGQIGPDLDRVSAPVPGTPGAPAH